MEKTGKLKEIGKAFRGKTVKREGQKEITWGITCRDVLLIRLIFIDSKTVFSSCTNQNLSF